MTTTTTVNTYALSLECGETVRWTGEFAHLPVRHFDCPCGSEYACHVEYRRRVEYVTTDRPDHVSSTVAYAEVADVMASAMAEGREISDAVALTIASWFSSPGTSGLAFATLATTGSVEARALLDAISDALAELRADRPHSRDIDALGCLATWAMNHPTRTR